jgi:hypothetical protein
MEHVTIRPSSSLNSFIQRSTYPFILTLNLFVLTSVSNTLFGLAFVIALAGLSSPWIYWISYNSLRLYNYRSTIISIIRRFFFVVLSLIKYSYKEYKSVQTTISRSSRSSCFKIILIIIAKT